jgi:uncharacterized protein (TIGR02391 family)
MMFNKNLPCFDSASLEAVCKVLGDIVHGLTGDQIGYHLAEIRVVDCDRGITKWRRLFNALARAQNECGAGNHTFLFIIKAMSPARYVHEPELFEWRRNGLNVALSFSAFAVNREGRVIRSTKETTIDGARARASRLHTILLARGTHDEVLKYCREELLAENYFHSVFEAVKGIGQRIREMSGLTVDGADLVAQVFSTKEPILIINSLTTETERSEQKGFANLLIGAFGAVRNPTAHAPKLLWSMPEQDAIDIFALLSFLHRKLDGARRVR